VSPLVRVERLGLATRTRPVFSDLSFCLERRTLTVVVGPSGSGRSALLLAVSGRMAGLTGTVRLGDKTRTRPAELRRCTSLARLATLVGPEDKLTVAESLIERALIDGVRVADAERAVAVAEQAFAVTLPRGRLVEELGAYEQALLCVALAVVRPAELVLLDDADRGLDVADQVRLYAALERLCATGPTVLAATTERAAVPAGVAVVPLPVRPGTPARGRPVRPGGAAPGTTTNSPLDKAAGADEDPVDDSRTTRDDTPDDDGKTP